MSIQMADSVHATAAHPEAEGVRHRFLLGGMQQMQITMAVRTQCLPQEVNRLDEIVSKWRGASRRMQELTAADAGAADRVGIEQLPKEFESKIKAIESNPLFKSSFSIAPTSFMMVEIDKLVAPQRDVNLDYVLALRDRLRGHTSPEDLFSFCLEPRGNTPHISTLQNGQNQVTFSSTSLDLRFLGGFLKPIGPEDIDAAHLGGQPVAVVALLIGFGAAPINAWAANGRLVLNNGFHRLIALRSEGVRKVPLVVQHAVNQEIEFPPHLLGLSREYLLHHPRPVLVGDFFDDALILEVRLKPRLKTLRVAWVPEDGVIATA